MNAPILVTMGEPAGVGPDLCVRIAKWFPKIVVAGNLLVLQERAKRLGLSVAVVDYAKHPNPQSNQLRVLNFPCPEQVIPGQLNRANAAMVLELLTHSGQLTLSGTFAALVTAPVHKAHLQAVDETFYGHTEFFQKICGAQEVVMMLADERLRVALVTTHLPLSQVAQAIDFDKIVRVVQVVDKALRRDFGISNPKIALAGLNPHAGEQGILGCEEETIIRPAILHLQQQGIDVFGPYPADTMFIEPGFDVFIAQYHDQGLGVIKYASFGRAANISLGLPIIRTSVDHGTALSLAGTIHADTGSLDIALHMAEQMIEQRGGLLEN